MIVINDYYPFIIISHQITQQQQKSIWITTLELYFYVLNTEFNSTFKGNKTLDFTFDFKRKKVYRLKTQVVSQVEPREEGKWFILIVRNSIVIFITLHNCGQAKHKSIFNFEFRRIVHKVEHIKSIICCTYTH